MKHGALFNGIGGFQLAAQWAGWENIFSSEINDFCNKITKYHFPNCTQHYDITKTDFTIYRGRINVLSGGFPCQGFSVAGLRLGTDDNRYLWPSYLRAIDEINPDWVVGENVTGILSMEDKSGVYRDVFAKVEHRKITRFPEIDYYEAVYTRQAKLLVNSICESLEERGYEVQTFAIPAAGVGAPHKRERIWFIACNTKCATYGGRDSGACSGNGVDMERDIVDSGRRKQGSINIKSSSGDASHTQCNGSSRCGHGETGCEALESEGQAHQRQRVRSKSRRTGGEGNVADANEPGLPKPGRKSGFKKTDAEFRTEFCSGEIISDTDKLNGNLSGFRTGEVSQQQETEVFGCDATNPNSIGSGDKEGSRDQSEREDTRDDEHALSTGREEQLLTGITTESRFSCGRHIEDWSNWPVESPICSRNDGISERLDAITFSNWRNESIKGAGNALVPQIPFEIFKIIDTLSKKQ